MLSLIDRHTGKVNAVALAITGTLHPQCSAPQPVWHHAPEEAMYVESKYPTDTCIPNLSIITTFSVP